MSDLIQSVCAEFKYRFGREPLMVESPGRVNLIGDHTDYNDGFVLPAAIQKRIVLGLSKNKHDSINAYSIDLDESESFDLHDLRKSDKQWANYIKGVVAELFSNGYSTGGFDLVFSGDIPIGAGLSSSAALEGGLLIGLSQLFDIQITRKEMARIGQLTEHNHVGVNCGIMDQFINLYGEEHRVLKLDCRSLEFERFPFERDDIKIVLCNSNVSHNLASSEYNIRRNQCDEGVEYLQRFETGVKNLRDVSYQMLEGHKDGLGDLVYKRCKFVLDENQRVLDACSDLQREDYESFGGRMYASHNGLSNDFEVSCSELDELVDIAKNLPGVFGSRMMGGGFGGCTVNLVQQEHVEAFQDAVSKKYKDRTGLETEIYITQISHGASVVEKTMKVKTD